jgi:hypothetical protein
MIYKSLIDLAILEAPFGRAPLPDSSALLLDYLME